MSFFPISLVIAFQAGLVNSLVHLFMYTYYGLAALKSERVNKYLKWKKYITKIQLVWRRKCSLKIKNQESNVLLVFVDPIRLRDCQCPDLLYIRLRLPCLPLLPLYSLHDHNARLVRQVPLPDV